MTLTSRFTNAGLDLLADWAAHPEHARPFSIMKLGTLTDAEYETKEYDGSETDITHTGSDDPVAELVVTTVKVTSTGGLAGSAVAKVTGALRPNVAGEGRELRGHHIREIGLFIDGASVPDPMILVWIGTFPDQYIPTEEESSIDVQMSITVPVKFDNAAAVQVVTDNALVEQRVATLENDVQTMNGGAATVTPKASQADMEKAAKCINKMNASGTPGPTLPELSQVNLKADQADFETLQKYARILNTGDETSTTAAKQKANQTDFEALQKYARKMNTGNENDSTTAAVQKANASDVTEIARVLNKLNTGGSGTTIPQIGTVSEKISGKFIQAGDMQPIPSRPYPRPFPTDMELAWLQCASTEGDTSVIRALSNVKPGVSRPAFLTGTYPLALPEEGDEVRLHIDIWRLVFEDNVGRTEMVNSFDLYINFTQGRTGIVGTGIAYASETSAVLVTSDRWLFFDFNSSISGGGTLFYSAVYLY